VRRGWATVRAVCLLGLVCASGASACGSDPEPEPAAGVVDAGPQCERGSENCACIGGGGCRDNLLCISGRCLLTDREEQPDPTPTPSRPRPPAPVEPGELDAGGAPNTAPDAGAAPGDAGATPEEPPPDASAAEPLDASGELPDAQSSS